MHIGQLIKQKMEEEGKTVSWLARNLSYCRTNVYKIYDKKSIDTDLLMRISALLEYNLPLYMEAGAAIQYRSYKDEESDSYYNFSQKCNLLSLNIPVNLLYRFNIKDDFSISPYFGLDFRINLLGKIKYEETYDGDTDSWDGNLFDDDDMDNEAWKRFQAGWHIGVGFDYRIIHIAIEYGTDFNEIAEKSKFATTAITLGLNF